MNIEMLRPLCILIKFQIQARHIIDPAVDIAGVPAAHHTVVRIFHIVLDDHTVVHRRQSVPHLLISAVFLHKQLFHRLRRVAYLRKIRDITDRRMEIDHVRRKRFQRRIGKHGVLIILVKLRLIELRFDPVLQ